MTAGEVIALWCDTCQALRVDIDGTVETDGELRRAAAEDGWSYPSVGTDLCSSCTEDYMTAEAAS